MNFKINISILAVAGLLLTGSCTKDLNEYNPAGATSETLVKTPEGFLTLVNGAYSYVPLMFGNDESMLFLSETGTDLWFNENKSSYAPEITQYKNFTPAVGLVGTAWKNLYAGINLCNFAINNIAQAGMTEDQRKTREAELRFLRGFYYWYIVETWGGVVLNTTETTTTVFDKKRSTVEEFYKLITSDLEFAADNLPATFSGTYEFGRATQASAKGFLARAYLSWGYQVSGGAAQQYFQKARDVAADIITNKAKYNLDLYANYADVWDPNNRNPNNGTKNKEAMFLATFSTNTSLNVNSNANRNHMWFLSNYSGYRGNAIPGLNLSIQYGNDQKNRRFMPTWGLLSMYNEDIDARYAGTFQEEWRANAAYTWTAADVTRFNKDKSLVGHKTNVGDVAMLVTKKAVAGQSTLPYVVYDKNSTYDANTHAILQANADRFVVLKKYLDPLTRIGLTSYPGYSNTIIMRLAEMYLIAAEADFQLGNNAEAASYINVLRTRAAIKTPVDHTGEMQVTSAQITLDFILDERARELCGEYQRWFDLKRTHKLGDRIKQYNPDITLFNDNYYLRPVPQTQMQAISNGSEFGQNPGY